MFAPLAALLLTVAPPKPFTHVATVEGVSEYRLPNGLRVLFVPEPSKPSTTVNLTVFVGSRHEDYGEKGMAHLFEHMLFKETKKFKDVKKVLAELGADANGTTWFDRTNYFESFAASDANLKLALDVEADRLVNAVVDKKKLEKEMTVVRNEFEMGENQPESVLLDRVASAAYLWHGYGNTTIGAKSDIENVPQERLIAFYKRYYQPDNAMLVVAGRFDEAKAFKWIAEGFGRIPKPTRTLKDTYTVEPAQDGERAVTIRRAGGTPVLVAAYHVPAGADPDFAAVDVLERVLGETPSGRLYKALVDGKQAATVSCGAFQLKEPGFLSCTAELGPKDSAATAKATLLDVLEGFARKSPTAEEVNRAKASILKQYDLLLNASDRVGIFLSEFAAVGDWRLLFLHRDRLGQVTPDDVARVAKKYLKPTNRTLGEYVPSEVVDRAEMPAPVDLAALVKDYKGQAGLSQGEAFQATPKNLEARTERLALKNGAKVALLPKKTRGGTVHLVLELNCGAEATLQGQRAPAEFVARLLARGTTKRSRQAFKDKLDELKASFAVKPTPQAVEVAIEVRRPQLEELLALVAEALTGPAFEPTEFESARREVLAELEQKKSDPLALGMVAMQQRIAPFPAGHPYAVPSFDEQLKQVAALELATVKAFHQRFYGAQAANVALAGDFDAAAVKGALEALLGGWTAKEPYVRIPNPYRPITPEAVTIDVKDKPMAFFGAALSFRMRDDDADYPAMVLADYLVGGGFLNGRIPARLREQEGLSYGAGTRLKVDAQDDDGVLFGYALYNPDNAQKVEGYFLEELDKAATGGFTEKEVASAKVGMLQEREQGRTDDGVLARVLADHLEVGRTWAYDGELDQKLRALSPAQVSQALGARVKVKDLAVVKVGDFKLVTKPK